ncbi:MAG: SAM-dependent methyltransferase [Gammaproteobacteria bacterium]
MHAIGYGLPTAKASALRRPPDGWKKEAPRRACSNGDTAVRWDAMSNTNWPFYEELDFCQTDLGELMLRRRRPRSMPETWVYEVKLDDRFLMSSLVHDSEDELARLSLRRLEGREWRVLVGGLGLGHTAAEVLTWAQVETIDVVEFLPEVIDWHRRELVPLAAELDGDDRCRIVQGDCFRWIRDAIAGSYDAVLIDVDDSPEHLLSPGHGSFYTETGLGDARRALRPGGVFALWTGGPVLEDFLDRMRRVFGDVDAVAVHFHNPLHNLDDVNTIYVAQV